jgi:GT2 family glycosyltransferase
MTPRVSVIVPARDAAAWISEQLDALAAQVDAPPAEVIVVDDGSVDDTAALAAAHPVVTTVVQLGRSAGAGAARNAGMREARGEHLVFTDADDVVGPCFLSGLVGALEAGAGVAAGRIVDFDVDPDDLEPIGPEPGHFGFLPYAGGSAIAVRRADLLAHGGFDPAFRFGQDIELSWRLQLAGLRFVRVPDAVLRYRSRPGERQRWLQRYARHRYQPMLFSRYRGDGMPRTPTGEGLRAWLWLLVHLPRLGDGHVRALWLDSSARRAGRLVGSLAARRLYL